MKNQIIKLLDYSERISKYILPLSFFFVFLLIMFLLAFSKISIFGITNTEAVPLAIAFLSLSIPTFVYVKKKERKAFERKKERENVLLVIDELGQTLTSLYVKTPGFFNKFLDDKVLLSGRDFEGTFPSLHLDSFLLLLSDKSDLISRDRDFLRRISQLLPKVEELKSTHKKIEDLVFEIKFGSDSSFKQIILAHLVSEPLGAYGPLEPQPNIFKNISYLTDLCGEHRQLILEIMFLLFEFIVLVDSVLLDSSGKQMKKFLEEIQRIDSDQVINGKYNSLANSVNYFIEEVRIKKFSTYISESKNLVPANGKE